MKVSQLMSKQVKSASPQTNLVDIAQTMQSQNIGAMPVEDQGKLVGIVTDRDIVLRSLAQEDDPFQMQAGDVMTSPAICCHADDEIDAATKLMRKQHVRRLPVLDAKQQFVGILSLDDVAAQASTGLAGETLKEVVEEQASKLILA